MKQTASEKPNEETTPAAAHGHSLLVTAFVPAAVEAVSLSGLWWRNTEMGKVLVNHFETLVAQHLGLPLQLCVWRVLRQDERE